MWFNSKELTAWRMGSSIMVVPQVASRHQSEGIQLPPRVVLVVMYSSILQSLLICSGSNSWKELRVEQLVPVYPGRLPELKGLARCLEPENEEKGVSHIPAHLPLKSRGLKK
ncbi:uncharacterized protein LOC130848087 isoform X2 [Hippopotamus amphibius kiboko]|uniref:uncharacterized protein LOC130848087 isoform X2 n=1 Tax=Hippopotamus amphibius kiboko TaxID=575201 RepID=UPI002591DAE8|nr:uncharacterized protein LOC130848087 isoform X2 [Hippopotamus amphibius kiboko]